MQLTSMRGDRPCAYSCVARRFRLCVTRLFLRRPTQQWPQQVKGCAPCWSAKRSRCTVADRDNAK
eukprot:1815816-Pleurochrysis_carterae.AAC.1